jgi:hypothetical protein
MRKAYITPKYRTVNKVNHVSGHRWTEDIPLSGFWVNGGLFGQSSHTTIESAEKECEERDGFNERHPFVMPRSQREIDNCKRMGIPLTEPYCLMKKLKPANKEARL